MHHSLFRLVLFLAVALIGCKRSDQPSPSDPPDNLNVNGVRYELPLTGSDLDRATGFLQAVQPNGLKWSGGGHTLEVADGKISLDGKPYGMVKAGDVVKLTAEGILFVNGEQRQPGS
jgi:hypothetical protein